VNNENATDRVLGMAPIKKKSKNAIKVYLTVINYYEITNFYQNKAHDNISPENLEIDLAVIPIRGSMGDGGTPKDAKRSKPMATPKVKKMKTTRKVTG
jgi:hypothetical protein